MAQRPTRISNQFRPLRANDAGSVDTDPDAFSGLADAYRFGWMGQLSDVIEAEADEWQQAPLDWDVKQHIPEGYEKYSDAFMKAGNMQAVETIRSQIDENLAIRARREARGGWSTFGSDVGASIIDPTNLVGAPLKGVGITMGALRGGVSIGAVGAATEVARGVADPTATKEETAWGAGGALVFGSVMGGAMGAWGRSAKPSPLPLPVKGRVTSVFGRRARPKAGASTNHPGTDIAIPVGTPVRAQRPGTVEAVTFNPKGGNIVTVRYSPNVVVKFMHLESASVAVGDVVKKGQIVAKSGATGNVTGPHLHYEMEVNGVNVDPERHIIDDGDDAPLPDGPDGGVSLQQGVEIPYEIDLDGRGVPVVLTTLDGAPARYVRGRRSIDVMDDATLSSREATAPMSTEPPTPSSPETRWPGIEGWSMKERKAQAKAEAKVAGVAPKTIEAEMAAEVKRLVKQRLDGAAVIRDEMGTPIGREGQYDPNRVADLANRYEKRADAAARAGADEDFVQSLYDRADDIRDELTHADGHLVTDTNGDVVWRSAEDRQRFAGEKMDEDLADLRAQDRVKMEQDLDSGELADELPFGMGHARDAATAAGDADRLEIDMEAVIEGYSNKAWTSPRIEGVTPFPLDAFPRMSDWLNFVVAHEREHIVNPRKEGESLAAYENRINKRAYDAVQGDKGSFQPTNSRLEKLAIAPTPMGQMLRAVPDPDAQVHQSIQDLAGDFGVMLVRNQIGGASSPGGSVFQKAQRWNGLVVDFVDTTNRQYLSYLGKVSKGSRLAVTAQLVRARLPGGLADGQLSLADFRREITRAIVDRDADVIPEVRHAAKVFTEAMNAVEREARELGVFQSTKGLRQRAERLRRRADAIEQRMPAAGEPGETDTFIEVREVVARMREEADFLDGEAGQLVMPAGEIDYYPRFWNVAAMQADEPGALAMLRDAYLREGSDPIKAEQQARGAFNTITMEPDGEFTPGRPSALNHRTVPATNAEAFPWIVQDPEVVMAAYMRRMGAAIEMTRRFGDAAGLDEVDTLRADLILRGVAHDERETALQLWEDARDRIAGGFHGKDPMSWDNRAVRALKNLTNLAVLGKVIYSQVSDIAKSVASVGTNTAMRTIAGVMSGDLARMQPGGYARQAGEALELTMARLTARFIESDDALIVTKESWIEKKLAAAQAPFFTMNLMMPFTVMMKELSGIMAAQSLIADARLVAAGAGEADQAVIARLAALGIDPQDAQLIASMPIEKSESGHLDLPNVLAWEPAHGEQGARARDLFLGAINGEVRRMVVTPGPLDRPAVMDGVFHTRKGRDEALQEVALLQQQRDAARLGMRGMDALQDDDPIKVAAVERLKEASAALNKARRTTGQKGRIEAPIASLPFQLHSFAVASGGKVLHGLLSGRERSRTQMVMALMAGGIMAQWLKSEGPGGSGRWDKMGYAELIGSAFDSSSLGAWMSDLVGAANTATGKVAEDALRAGVGADPAFNPDGAANEIGAVAGAGPGLVAGLVEPFVTDADTSARVNGIRRILPYNNLLWVKGMFDTITDAIEGESIEVTPASEPDAPIEFAYPYGMAAKPEPVDPGRPIALPELMPLGALPAPEGATRLPRTIRRPLL